MTQCVRMVNVNDGLMLCGRPVTAYRIPPDQFGPVGHRAVIGQRTGPEHLGQLTHDISFCGRRFGKHPVHCGPGQHLPECIGTSAGAEKSDRVHHFRIPRRKLLGEHGAK